MKYSNEQAEKRMRELETKPSNIKGIASKILNIDSIMQMEFPEAEWLIDKLVPLQGITIISGAPATYKTWLLMQMAINITESSLFLNKFQCTKSGILVIDEENQLRLIKKRMGLLHFKAGRPIHYLSQEDFSALDLDLINEVIVFCDENELDTIFIDSLVRVSNTDENGAQEMAKVFKGIKKFCKAGKTVIITHHGRKAAANRSASSADSLRGSSDILAAVDCHLAIKRSVEDKNKLTMEQPKLRTDEETEPFTIEVLKEDDGNIRFEHSGVLINEKIEQARAIIFDILGENKAGLSMTAISDKVRESSLSIGKKAIFNILNAMIKNKEIESKSGAKNTTICFPLDAETDEQTQLDI